jgi:hypothetical protein
MPTNQFPQNMVKFITDPNYFCSYNSTQVVWGSGCQSVQWRAREYNMVGVRWCRYICKCTWVYIGKLNILQKIMSLQWSFKWELNILTNNINHLVCTAHWQLWVKDLECICQCYLCFLPTVSAAAWLSPLFMTATNPVSQVLLDTCAGRCKHLMPTHYFHLSL